MTNTINKVIRNGTEYEFNAVNGGVTSVNGDTGAVTVNDVKKSATAPSSPIEGMVWYDTTNDQLKVYDGSQWNVTGKEYNAGNGIGIGNDYTAMQGPCPGGFHIPLKSECGSLYNTIIDLGITWDRTCGESYLKIPYFGRLNTTGNPETVNQSGVWTSTNANSPTKIAFGNYTGGVTNIDSAYGLPIRPFKDTPVVPDNTWTTLYDGSSVAAGAGIFHNSTLGLISVSSDGINWITITDKNIGATTVYNSGDGYNAYNVGYCYQWGNCHGFSYSNQTHKSTTKVNVTGYGPNEYNSSIFISGNTNWMESTNSNLRGGVTGIITDAIYNTGVRSINGLKGDADFNNGKNIKIGSRDSRQGPCPEGFIIPSTNDFNTIKIMGETLGAWTTGTGCGYNMGKYLKMGATARITNTGSVMYAGGEGSYSYYSYYWTRSRNTQYGITFSLSANNINTSISNSPSKAYPIRPIKLNPEKPTNTWTTLFDGSSIAIGAGIFHNATSGLISISADGENWMTIADKNVGATTCYDQDTMNNMAAQKIEVNGYLFQWGNNYPFTTGPKIISNQKIDVSGFGPSSYYSEIFRTATSNSNSWILNNIGLDLWGDQSGIIESSIYDIESKSHIFTELKDTGILQESDRMGPCPSGFHIPSASDFDNFDAIMFTLTGKTTQIQLYGDNTICGYLKMPGTGSRKNSSPGTIESPTYRYFWTCSRSNAQDARIGGYYGSSRGNRTCRGLVIRPFKNEPVTPDNTWTTMLDGSTIAAGAGVFWNENEGIISISADGTTWMTISDKNCGATKVWNYGDTVTDENKGLYYQRGNNYGFPASGDLPKTSTTRISSIGYGPGNYFYGDTFIYNNSSWENPENYNLWGDRTGGTWGNGLYNAGVISVNGQKGHLRGIATESYVDSAASSVDGISTTQPSTPVAGSTYFNTTTGTMMVYNGTEWVEVGAGGGIENDTTGTTTTISKVWAGSEDEFTGLSSKTEGVIYNVFGDGGSEGGGGLGEPTLLATITSDSTATQINTSSKWLYVIIKMISGSNRRAITNLIYVPALDTTQWAYGDYNYSAKIYKDGSGNIQVVNKFSGITTYVYEL